jgi:hypothetical protein
MEPRLWYAPEHLEEKWELFPWHRSDNCPSKVWFLRRQIIQQFAAHWDWEEKMCICTPRKFPRWCRVSHAIVKRNQCRSIRRVFAVVRRRRWCLANWQCMVSEVTFLLTIGLYRHGHWLFSSTITVAR